MKTVSCECKKCQAAVGSFANLWLQVGRSYLGPVIEPDEELAIRCEGKTRIGERNTLVEEYQLQDILYGNCSAILGLRCIRSPLNHVLDDNQILLSIASVILLDTEGEDIELEIKRVLSVNEPSRVNNGGAPDPSYGTSPSSTFPEYIKGIDNNGCKIVTGLNKRVGHSIRGAQEGLKSLKSDLNGFKKSGTETSAAIEDLANRLSSADSTLEEVQQQVSGLAGEPREEVSDLKSELHQANQELEMVRSAISETVRTVTYNHDMAAMRAEIAQLRTELDDVHTTGSDRPDPHFPSRELEILTSNIAKIGNRASQVETLQMEFDILKGRVDRAEANQEASNNRRLTYPLDSEAFFSHTRTRKRASSPKPETSSERTVSSNHISDSMTSGYSAVPLTPSSQDTARDVPRPKKRGRKPKNVTGNSSTSQPVD
ncbi:hypothetical protein B0T21DRAFT_386459 [Apiosordaria backusii]|uniref:Uncharacterized protein n=1 Tax=Apiosordaria backusii TaxID=314023 RepID=A0AA40AMX8_9PEZI|nr:hypothetical protein B0T21DRAFT_386459 [Apiosordaria backusii]